MENSYMIGFNYKNNETVPITFKFISDPIHNQHVNI